MIIQVPPKLANISYDPLSARFLNTHLSYCVICPVKGSLDWYFMPKLLMSL